MTLPFPAKRKKEAHAQHALGVNQQLTRQIASLLV